MITLHHFARLSSAAAWAASIAALFIAFLISARNAHAAPGEATIVPSVYQVLGPTSAIQVPMQFAADQTSVWRADLEHRMLLSGNVHVTIGYRTLRADSAAVWLTPSRESGESTWDVAIYLSGNVEVREGAAKTATTTLGKELLVTTRVAQNVPPLLSGTPISKAEEDSPVVKRGNDLKSELLNRPLA